MHLVSLSAVTWDFPLVGRTRMLTEAWQRAGQAATFVEVPSFRTALGRLTRAARRGYWPGVVSPWPTYPARTWTALSRDRLEHAISRRAAALRRQLDASLDWSETVALVISPVWAPWLDELPFRAVIYDCIDDLKVHVPHPRLQALYEAWEDELIARASAAVVSAEILGDRLRARRPGLEVATIRNGVNCEDFQRIGCESPRPSDLPNNGRPVVGFVGALSEWMDWRLMSEVPAALPEFDFVFVGPQERRTKTEGTMPTGPNIFYTGAKPYSEVPAYMAAFDVCWVPFDASRVSISANPVKIYEYLSLGKPVVSTPIADPEIFAGVVVFAEGAAEIAAELKRAIGREEGAARVEFARANSWDTRASQYVEFIAKRHHDGTPSLNPLPARANRRP